MNNEKEAQIQNLSKEIIRLEKLHEKNKIKRLIITFICIGSAIYGIGLNCDWFDYMEGLIIAPVFAVIYIFISSIIFSQLINISNREEKSIEHLKEELRKIQG